MKNDINQLFDEFSVSYQHSLYAIERAKKELTDSHANQRRQEKRTYERKRSIAKNRCANKLMANMHKLNEICEKIDISDDSVIKVAEFLKFGTIEPKKIDQLLFNNRAIDCIIPFIGHGNIMIESRNDDCQTIGLQFVLNGLKQTAPGQLHITVINPELRPEFYVFADLPEFNMVTKNEDINNTFLTIEKEIVENDALLKGTFPSIVALRKQSKQPVGKLRLLVIQNCTEIMKATGSEIIERIIQEGPRAGITTIIINKINSKQNNINSIKHNRNTSVFIKNGDNWENADPQFKELIYSFPIMETNKIYDLVRNITEKSKVTSAITIPFNKIENIKKRWTETSANNLIINLGKSGLDTVSICIGDQVTQSHNVLISGAVGKGKSNLLEVMIHSMCLRYSPNELELYLLDFKDGLTFQPYSNIIDKSWLPHARILGLESDRDVGLAVLKDLEEERLKRAEHFRNSSVGVIHNYSEYRKCYPTDVIPRIVLIIDEYQKLFEYNDYISNEAAALLENLVRQGRACAIHVVLASQSINGTAGLLGKDEQIYSQFPIRIALQNTVSESYALFGIGNDAAAKLRIRGEAIINCNYGDIDWNQKIVVAYSDSDKMKLLRSEWCENWGYKRYPLVFRKNEIFDLTIGLKELKQWRKEATENGIYRIPFGIRLSIKRNILSLPFINDVGKNIAILGSAENLHKQNILPGKRNMAIGLIQSIGFSLAIQHFEGNARFILIDGITKDISCHSNLTRWLCLMERFGYPVECIASEEAAIWLIEFWHEIRERDPEEDIYILGLGMDRCKGFNDMNINCESGAECFQNLLKCGSKGIHFICWWTNIGMFNNHIGFGNDGYFETKVLLRIDKDLAKDVLGPFTNWSIRDNRAYIHDNSELSEDTIVIPLMPFTNRLIGIIESEDWDNGV